MAAGRLAKPVANAVGRAGAGTINIAKTVAKAPAAVVRAGAAVPPDRGIGLRDLTKTLFSPRLPWEGTLTQRFPNAAPRVFTGLRAIPKGVAAWFGGKGLFHAATALPDQVTDAVDSSIIGGLPPDERRSLWWRTFWRQPSLVNRVIAPPILGGDHTSIGNSARDALTSLAIPEVISGLNPSRTRDRGKTVAQDLAAALTPAGVAQRLALRAIPPQTNAARRQRLVDFAGRNAPHWWNDAEFFRSPLLHDLASLVPESMVGDMGASTERRMVGALLDSGVNTVAEFARRFGQAIPMPADTRRRSAGWLSDNVHQPVRRYVTDPDNILLSSLGQHGRAAAVTAYRALNDPTVGAPSELLPEQNFFRTIVLRRLLGNLR